MSDIVERLRGPEPKDVLSPGDAALGERLEAADEIEHTRKQRDWANQRIEELEAEIERLLERVDVLLNNECILLGERDRAQNKLMLFIAESYPEPRYPNPRPEPRPRRGAAPEDTDD